MDESGTTDRSKVTYPATDGILYPRHIHTLHTTLAPSCRRLCLTRADRLDLRNLARHRRQILAIILADDNDVLDPDAADGRVPRENSAVNERARERAKGFHELRRKVASARQTGSASRSISQGIDRTLVQW